MDNLKRDNSLLDEKLIMQIGFSTYKPRYCEWKQMFSYHEMKKIMEEARIIITHGGPSSFILPLQMKKIPIVVPRQKEFKEHINNHQMEFCEQLSNRYANIITVTDVRILKTIIFDYEKIIKKMNVKMNSNNSAFNQQFCQIVDQMFESG